MEPVEYARLLRRRWRVVAACVLVAASAALITTPSTPIDPVVDWAATHTLVREPGVTTPAALATVALLASTGEVPRRVAEETGFDGPPALLARRIEVTPDELTGTLAITATARSPETAADLANLWATQTLGYLGDEERRGIGDSLEAAEARVAELRIDIDELGADIAAAEEAGEDPALLSAERDANLRQFGAAFEELQRIEDAPPPSSGYVTLELAIPELAEATGSGINAPRSRPVRAGIGGFLGLLLGVALVLVLERVDPRLRTRSATEDAFALPVLATVPVLARGARSGIVAVTDPGSIAAEAYRSVRSGILLMGVHVLSEPSVPGGTVQHGQTGSSHGSADPHVILVTSPAPGEGKSTTAANLAAVFAETGSSVLVLGCDFRRPEVHRFFDVAATVGLSDVLAGGPDAPSLAEVVKPTRVKGVKIVTNGDPLKNFGDVAAASRRLVDEARTLADIVIIDTAPLLATNDAVELIPLVDTVVLVSRSGQTTRDSARLARELVARLAAPVAGVVLVGAPTEGHGFAGYYSAGPAEPLAPSAEAVAPAATPVPPSPERKQRTQRPLTEPPRTPTPTAAPAREPSPAPTAPPGGTPARAPLPSPTATKAAPASAPAPVLTPPHTPTAEPAPVLTPPPSPAATASPAPTPTPRAAPAPASTPPLSPDAPPTPTPSPTPAPAPAPEPGSSVQHNGGGCQGTRPGLDPNKPDGASVVPAHVGAWLGPVDLGELDWDELEALTAPDTSNPQVDGSDRSAPLGWRGDEPEPHDSAS